MVVSGKTEGTSQAQGQIRGGREAETSGIEAAEAEGLTSGYWEGVAQQQEAPSLIIVATHQSTLSRCKCICLQHQYKHTILLLLLYFVTTSDWSDLVQTRPSHLTFLAATASLLREVIYQML